MGGSLTEAPAADARAQDGGGSRRRPVVLSVTAVVWALVVGGAGWAAVREPPALPTPGFVMEFEEVAPLMDTPFPFASVSGPSGSGYSYAMIPVGGDGALLLEAVWDGVELPETVPARPPAALTLEQRQAFDLATLEGEEAIEAWRAEVGHHRPFSVPRGRVVADLDVPCARLLVSADRTGPIDRAALAELTATFEEQMETWLVDDGRCEEVGRG